MQLLKYCCYPGGVVYPGASDEDFIVVYFDLRIANIGQKQLTAPDILIGLVSLEGELRDRFARWEPFVVVAEDNTDSITWAVNDVCRVSGSPG